MLANNQKSASGVTRNLGMTLFAVLVSLLMVGVQAWAQDTETKKAPLKLGSAKSTAKPKGLAAYASTLKLKKGDDATISNSSLKSSNKGTLSIGGGVTTGAAPANQAAGGPGGGSSKSETWGNDYEEQKRRIADLEKSIAENGENRSSTTDPYNQGAYHRAGGQVSNYDVAEENAKKQLDEERKRLERMRREARRDGVNLKNK